MKENKRPNVILVMTDDQGYGDFSCHGNPVVNTPFIDNLYNESIRFTDFHVAPMCAPTRGQLMTGRDALCNGAYNVFAGKSFPRSSYKQPRIRKGNGIPGLICEHASMFPPIMTPSLFFHCH